MTFPQRRPRDRRYHPELFVDLLRPPGSRTASTPLCLPSVGRLTLAASGGWADRPRRRQAVLDHQRAGHPHRGRRPVPCPPGGSADRGRMTAGCPACDGGSATRAHLAVLGSAGAIWPCRLRTARGPPGSSALEPVPACSASVTGPRRSGPTGCRLRRRSLLAFFATPLAGAAAVLSTPGLPLVSAGTDTAISAIVYSANRPASFYESAPATPT